MTVRRLLLTLTPLLILCLSATPAPAETVVEAWRSPFGIPRAVSVNPTDGSCWAATGSSVMHLAADHTVLSQTNGFWSPQAVSVNPTDGSCRVADTRNGEVVRLDSSGTELWRVGGFNGHLSISVNAADGSCWVADTTNNQVVHLASDGSELWRGGGFNQPGSVSVNSSDNSCWVADRYNNQVVHLDSDGAELWRGGGFYYPRSVSVNPTDGSCWVADTYNNQVVHLDSDGTELWRSAGTPTFYRPQSVSVNSSDSSCWVADTLNNRVVHLDASGGELWWGGGFNDPIHVSADSGDNSCWVVDWLNRELVHLGEHGAELWRRGTDFSSPEAVALNPTDGSCRAADTGNKQVVHLSADGMEQWREPTSWPPYSLAVNSTDDSCWVGGAGPSGFGNYLYLARLAPSGAELWVLLLPGLNMSTDSVSANPSDGSGWAAASTVSHLDAAGTELWSGTESYASSVSVNPTDNSCWVAYQPGNQLVHLAEDGTELWRGGDFQGPRSVSVDPIDGSCSVADNAYVVRLDANGAELWRRWGFQSPNSVSANPTDGSCWVADTGHDEVVHLDPDGVELWRGGGFENPASVSVDPIDGSCWVADRDNDQIVRLLPSPYDYNALVITGSGGVVLVDGVAHRVSWAGAFAPSATLTLEAVPDAPCYEFTGWSGHLTGTENPTIITLDTDKSVTANFAIGQNTLSLAKSGGGGIEVDGTPVALPWSDAYDCGISVTLQAVPDGGWHFLSWSGDLAGSPNPADVTVDADKSMTANFTTAPHTSSITASCDPSTVPSAGTTICTATILDSYGHGVASCSWDDGGAGGSFDPSPDVQNPTYTAPANTTDSSLIVTLTVNATCDGPEPLGDSDSTSLTVEPVAHVFEVTANPPVPTTVPSGGSASLWANFFDSRTGHSPSCSWDDGGAGGSFSPSGDVQNPTYTAPENEGPQDLLVTLTVNATCGGSEPLGDSDSTSLTVEPVPHTFEVTANAPSPDTVPSGGSADLSVSYSDSLGHGVASWSWDDAGAGGTFDPSPDTQNPTYTAPMNLTGSDLFITLTVNATCDGLDPLGDDDSTIITVLPIPIPKVLLDVHPNEQAPGVAGQLLGDPYWTAPGASGTGGYTWKTYSFAGSPYLWIQVCAQAQRASNTPSGIADRLQMLVDGVYVADYWADNMAAPPSYQWDGNFALDQGRRKTLRFLSMGVPGVHTIRFKASQYPILWWVKVSDLEPGVIEPPG